LAQSGLPTPSVPEIRTIGPLVANRGRQPPFSNLTLDKHRKTGVYTDKHRAERGETDMYAEERLQFIVQRARMEGRVDVAALADGLNVTAETIRRDLTALERQGLLRRVHGGAIPVERLRFERSLDVRDALMQSEKERIAKAALDELPEQGTILLDAGTTTARVAEILPAERELTVVTNSLPIAMTLAAQPNNTVLMVGGRVRGRTLAAVDDWATRVLADTCVDVAFIGTNGVSTERGLTTPDVAEAAVKRAMLANAIPTLAVLPSGGFEGAQLTGLLATPGVEVVLVRIAGAVRANISIVEPDGTVTKINEPGPALTTDELDALSHATVRAAAGAEWLAASGSLPPGAPPGFYARLIGLLAPTRCRIAIDSSGEPLLRVLPLR